MPTLTSTLRQRGQRPATVRACSRMVVRGKSGWLGSEVSKVIGGCLHAGPRRAGEKWTDMVAARL